MADADSGEDWRLCAHLSGDGPAARPHGIVGRFRDPQVVRDAERAVGPDVHLTHDGTTLFAYASDRATLDGAREAIVGAIEGDGLSADVIVSRWDERAGDWAQVDPPLDEESLAAREQAVRDGQAPTTQTFVVQVGREMRPRFEASVREWADRLGVECELVEHPHLLQTQVAITVSGPARAVQEFRGSLGADEWQTIRSAESLSFGI